MRHVYCVFNLVQQRVYAFRKQNDWSYRHDLSRPLSRPLSPPKHAPGPPPPLKPPLSRPYLAPVPPPLIPPQGGSRQDRSPLGGSPPTCPPRH
jgi:hypothetical protein